MKAPRKLTRDEQEVRGNLKTKYLAPDKEWLCDQYVVQGKSANQISDEVDAGESGEIVKRWLEQLGIPVRKYYHEMPEIAVLRSLYVESEMTAVEIAAEYRVDPGTVRRWLKLAEIAFRPISHRPGRGRSKPAAKRYLFASEVPWRCAWCDAREQPSLGYKGILQMHHRDHNPENNNLDNLYWMCWWCHNLETRLWIAKEAGKIQLESLGDGQLLITLVKQK